MTILDTLAAATAEAEALIEQLATCGANNARLQADLAAANQRIADLEEQLANVPPPDPQPEPEPELGFPGPGTVGHTVRATEPVVDLPVGTHTMKPGEALRYKHVRGDLVLADGATVDHCVVDLRLITVPAQNVPRVTWCTLGPDKKIEGTVDWKVLRRVVQSGGPVQLFRCDMRGMVDILFIEADGIEADESYLHGNYWMAVDPGQSRGESHPDGMQTWNGRRIRLRRCNVAAFSWGANDTFDKYLGKYRQAGQHAMTSGVLVKVGNYAGHVVDDVEVSDCLLDGYVYNMLYAVQTPMTDGSVLRPTNVRFLRNRIRRTGVIDRVLSANVPVTWEGNVDADTGAPITQAEAMKDRSP